MSDTESTSTDDSGTDYYNDEEVPPAAWIDRTAGTGSRSQKDEFNDSNSIQVNDGRGQTRTTFYVDYSDDDVDHQQYERLARINDGQYARERSSQNHEAEKRNFTRLAADRLDLSDHQTERALYIVEHVDMAPFAASHKTTEQVTLGVLSLVFDQEQAPAEPEEWDIEDWIVYDDTFQEFMESVDMEMEDLWTVRKMLMDTEFFEANEL